jgi:para-nitrobenzyl esterase
MLTAFVTALTFTTSVFAQPSESKNLEGTWQLVKIQNRARKNVAPDDGSKYTLAFENVGRLSARIDCNRGRGTWKVSGTRIQFGPLALTRALCPPDSLHDRMVKDLAAVRSFKINGGHLFLTLKGNAGVYEFEPAGSLFGRKWKLTEILGVAIENGRAHIEFSSNPTRVSGNGGCNMFSGDAEVSGSRLKLSRLISTKRACVDTAIQDIENRFMRALEQVTGYELRGDKLVLLANERSVLGFDAQE